MEVYIEKEDKTANIEAKTVKELLEKLKINPTTVLVVRDDSLITEKSELKNSDKIKLIPVISGG